MERERERVREKKDRERMSNTRSSCYVGEGDIFGEFCM